MYTETTESPVRTPPTIQELEILENRLMGLQETASALRNRLDPVLEPAMPRADPASNGEKAQQSPSPLTHRLARANAELVVLGSVLQDILNRLDV